MLLAAVAATALMTASPSNASTKPAPTKDMPAEKETKEAKNKKNDFDFGKFMLLFDKIFPAQPDPAPERLALSRVSMQRLLPDGAYGRAFGTMAEGLADRILNMSESDLDFLGKKDDKAPNTATLRDSLVKDDPYFIEREKIIRRVVREELVKMFAIMEPSLREGLAKALARRLDEKQLNDLNTFLATDSGKAFGEQNVGMWFDPDIARSIFQAMPGMIMAAPGIKARIDKETAHLPKPPKKEKAKEDEGKDEPTEGTKEETPAK